MPVGEPEPPEKTPHKNQGRALRWRAVAVSCSISACFFPLSSEIADLLVQKRLFVPKTPQRHIQSFNLCLFLLRQRFKSAHLSSQTLDLLMCFCLIYLQNMNFFAHGQSGGHLLRNVLNLHVQRVHTVLQFLHCFQKVFVLSLYHRSSSSLTSFTDSFSDFRNLFFKKANASGSTGAPRGNPTQKSRERCHSEIPPCIDSWGGPTVQFPTLLLMYFGEHF